MKEWNKPQRKKFKRTLRRAYGPMWYEEDHLKDRQKMAENIKKREEGGQVAIVYGGVDCDGGRWDDRVELVPAQVMAVIAWRNDYQDGAEGPQWYGLQKLSDVVDLTPSSRDLALEAFEDGHPHSIYI